MTYTIPMEDLQALEDLREELAQAISGGMALDLQQAHDTLRAVLDHSSPIPQIRRIIAHGQVLRPENIDYSDAVKLGKVVVEYRNGPDYGISVVVSDFDFQKASSCRDTVTKGCAWARDALSAAIEVDRLAPGGTMIIAAD